MGLRFNAWWKVVEDFIMPMGRIGAKWCMQLFFMSIMLATNSPWYSPISTRQTFIFEFSVYMMFAFFIYPDIKQIYLHFKEAFNPENRAKARAAFKALRRGENN
jgi:hypothetical protein